MKVNPVKLLSETQNMNGYQLIDWLKGRTEEELRGLKALSNILIKNVKNEEVRREKEENNE